MVVMDMNLPGAHSVLMSFPEEGEEVDLINHFADSDSEARPDFVALSAKVREWISLAEGKERLVFSTPQQKRRKDARLRQQRELPAQRLLQVLLLSQESKEAFQKLDQRSTEWQASRSNWRQSSQFFQP